MYFHNIMASVIIVAIKLSDKKLKSPKEIKRMAKLKDYFNDEYSSKN